MSDRFVRTLARDDVRAATEFRLACPEVAAYDSLASARARAPYRRALRETLLGPRLANAAGVMYPWRHVASECVKMPRPPRLLTTLDAPGCMIDRDVQLYDVSRTRVLVASLIASAYVMPLNIQGDTIGPATKPVEIVHGGRCAVRWSSQEDTLYTVCMDFKHLCVYKLGDGRANPSAVVGFMETTHLPRAFTMEECAGALAVGVQGGVLLTDVRGPTFTSMAVNRHYAAYALAACSDGWSLAVGTTGDGAHLFDVRTMRRYAHVMPSKRVKCLAWNPARRTQLLCASESPGDSGATCVEARSDVRTVWHAKTEDPVSGATWGDGVATLFSGCRETLQGATDQMGAPVNMFSVVDGATGATLLRTEDEFEYGFTHMAADPNGGVAVVACTDRETLSVFKTGETRAAPRRADGMVAQTIKLR